MNLLALRLMSHNTTNIMEMSNRESKISAHVKLEATLKQGV